MTEIVPARRHCDVLSIDFGRRLIRSCAAALNRDWKQSTWRRLRDFAAFDVGRPPADVESRSNDVAACGGRRAGGRPGPDRVHRRRPAGRRNYRQR